MCGCDVVGICGWVGSVGVGVLEYMYIYVCFALTRVQVDPLSL